MEGDEESSTPEPWRPNPSVLDDPERFGYKVYSRAFDEEVEAEALSSPDELERLRAFLDKELRALSSAVARLANRLQRRLLAQQNRAWDFDLEEGTLDAGRLQSVQRRVRRRLLWRRLHAEDQIEQLRKFVSRALRTE